MYRDDPLDDEFELRAIAGDEAVDELDDDSEAILAACDLLALLRGWVSDEVAGRWLTSTARRLDDRTPLEAIMAGDVDLATEACEAYIAAQG